MGPTTEYDMLLWGYPPHDSTAILPGMIRLLDEVTGQPLGWHSLGRPDDPAPTSQAGWAALQEKQRNPNFGSLDLFFGSPNGMKLSLCVDAPAFFRDFDALWLEFDAEHLAGPKAMLSFDRLHALFVQSLRLFSPFWARVGDEELTYTDVGKIYLSVDVTKVPDTIYWFNFFDSGMVERLGGREKLLGAPAYMVTETDDPVGVILILQAEPFDYHNPEHRLRLEAINQYFDLQRLHALYPKRR